MRADGSYKKVIESIKLSRGNNRSSDDDEGKMQDIGILKCLFLREDKKNLIPLPKVKKFLHLMLKQRSYICRVYCLKGIGLTTLGDDSPETYIQV